MGRDHHVHGVELTAGAPECGPLTSRNVEASTALLKAKVQVATTALPDFPATNDHQACPTWRGDVGSQAAFGTPSTKWYVVT